MIPEMNADDKETQDMKDFLKRLHDYQKAKGVTPQLTQWYYSEEGQDANTEFAYKLQEAIETKLLASDVLIEPSIQGLIGIDVVSFKIGNNEYQLNTDWTEEQNCIFFNGPEKASEIYYNRVRDFVVNKAKEIASTK